MDTAFRAFLDLIDTAQDETAIRQITKNFAVSIGYERFAYLQLVGTDMKTFNTYAKSWEDEYFEKELSRVDPVVSEAKRRMTVFPWSADNWSSRSSDLRHFRDAAISHGIRSGITIPIPGSFGSTIMLTFASSSVQSAAAACLSPEAGIQAALAIHYQLRAISAGRIVTPKNVFSSKEAVCVTWSAKGNGTAEIAGIMGITQRTAQHYLDSARRKVGAVNIQHLTALATKYGLIDF